MADQTMILSRKKGAANLSLLSESSLNGRQMVRMQVTLRKFKEIFFDRFYIKSSSRRVHIVLVINTPFSRHGRPDDDDEYGSLHNDMCFSYKVLQ